MRAVLMRGGELVVAEVAIVRGYTPEEFAGTLSSIASEELDVGPLITGRVTLDEVPEAFRALSSPDAHAKILVVPERR